MASQLEKEFRKWAMEQLKKDLIREKRRFMMNVEKFQDLAEVIYAELVVQYVRTNCRFKMSQDSDGDVELITDDDGLLSQAYIALEEIASDAARAFYKNKECL